MAKKNEGTEVVEKVVMRPLSSLVRNPRNRRTRSWCGIIRTPEYGTMRNCVSFVINGEGRLLTLGERRLSKKK